jgi:hypothetical protein
MAEAPSVARVGLPSEVHDAPKAAPAPVAKNSGVQQIHHVFRTFSQLGGGVGGSMPGSAIDDYLNEFLAVGWRVHSVHHVVNVPEGHTFCWCLIREL